MSGVRPYDAVLMIIAGHELTHRLQQLDVESYNKLKDFVMSRATDAGFQKYVSEFGDVNLAQEEFVSDWCMKNLFADEKTIKEITKQHSKLAQAILDVIHWIKDKLGMQGGAIDRAAELWNKAYNESAKVSREFTVEDGKVSFSEKSVEALTKENARELLEMAKNGELGDRTYFPIRRNTPKILLEMVKKKTGGKTILPDNPIIIQVSKARQAMEEYTAGTKETQHDISIDLFIEMIEGMDKPSYIVSQSNGRYAEVVRLYEGVAKPILAVIEFDSPDTPNSKSSSVLNGYNGGVYNVLVTAYSPSNLNSYLTNEDNEVIYKKEKGSPQSESKSIFSSYLNGSPFADSISHSNKKSQDVSENFLKGNAAYMEAVNRGDTEAAQAMVDEAAKANGKKVDNSSSNRYNGNEVKQSAKRSDEFSRIQEAS